ncbi:MAG TPA: hypothetical protein VN428_17665 [Bryobacteraceae bacterium]|nr:hypothetical protein [Bryobacteraceae bacterium]
MSPQFEELARDQEASWHRWEMLQIAIRVMVWIYAVVVTVIAVGFLWRSA